MRLEQRIEDQTKLFNELKKLHENRVINQQRYFEAVAALDLLQRDRQNALSGLSQTNTALEKAQRELENLVLAKNARIAKEETEAEQELNRLNRMAKQTRELAAGLDTATTQSNSGLVPTYKIMRRNAAGGFDFLRAGETTPIKPGDVIQIDIHQEAEPYGMD